MKIKNSKRGFSLVELLIVVSVIGILLAIAAPNVFSLLNAHTLTGEGTLLRNKLTLAQQMALAKNSDVEVRFFKMEEEGSAGGRGSYRAFQLFMYNELGEMNPITDLFRVKPPAFLNENMSTLLGAGSTAEGRYEVNEGSRKVSREFVGFRFKPDGSTDLDIYAPSGDTWYLVLIQGEENLGGSTLPKNYFVVQVDPFNGRVTEFRP